MSSTQGVGATHQNNKQSQQNQDGSQSNRDKLYKRFKKLNAYGPSDSATQGGQQQILQNHRSQNNLAYQGEVLKQDQMCELNTQQLNQNSSQVSADQLNNAQTAFVSPAQTLQVVDQVRIGNNQQQQLNPHRSPTSGEGGGYRKNSNNAAAQRVYQNHQHNSVHNGQIQQSSDLVFKNQIPLQSVGAQNPQISQPRCYSNQQQESLTQLRDQFKRKTTSKGRNQGRQACSTSSASKIMQGQIDQASSNSNLPMHGMLNKAYQTVSSNNLAYNRNRGEPQQMSTRSFKQDCSSTGGHQQQQQQIMQQSQGGFNFGKKMQSEQQMMYQGVVGGGGGKQLQYMSQSSDQSAAAAAQYSNQLQQNNNIALNVSKTNQNSQTNLDLQRQSYNQLSANGLHYTNNHMANNGAYKQNQQQTISVHSDLDINPLNDSHLYQISSQVRRYPNQGGQPGFNFNQSSVTNNEALSYSKLAGANSYSASSLWLNEDLDPAQIENRIRQSNFQQPPQQQQLLQQRQDHQRGRMQPRTSNSPENSNLFQTQRSQLMAQRNAQHLQTQSSESHQKRLNPKFMHSVQQINYEGASEDQQRLQQQHLLSQAQMYAQQKMEDTKNLGGLSRYNQQQDQQSILSQKSSKSYKSNNLAQHQANLNQAQMMQQMQYQQEMNDNMSHSGRFSHQFAYPSHMSDAACQDQMRGSYQGLLPSHQFKNQLVMGDEVLNKKTDRSQQVSVAQFGEQYQHNQNYAAQNGQRQQKSRSSERFHPHMLTKQFSQVSRNIQNKHDNQNNTNNYIDPDQSSQYQNYEKTNKYSTRTNPYTNLLSSNFIGSTAPSAAMDQLTASQMNSCSQFVTGNQTIGAMNTMPSVGPIHQSFTAGGGITQTLDRMNFQEQQQYYDLQRNQASHNSLPKNVEQQEYTNQVAQSLLAQVKPGILKLIQTKVDTIVQELCDEGFYDQRTIMKVLEHRADQLFPENFMVGLGDTSQSQHQDVDYHEQTQQNDRRPTSQSGMTNPVLFSSHNNFSNNDIPLDRSIYSDTMVTQEQNKNQNYTLNLLRTLKEQSLEASDLRSEQYKNTQGTMQEKNDSQIIQQALLKGLDEVANQFNSGKPGLNTTEKIINAIHRPQSDSGTDQGQQPNQLALSQTENQQFLGKPYTEELVEDEYGDNQVQSKDKSEQDLNTDRLIKDIRDDGKNQGQTGKGRNFNSRKIQKSDDFKITFAYTSKNQSIDLDQASNGNYHNQNSLGIQQPQNNIQLEQENLVSFNPADNNQQLIQSPVLSNDQIIDNIKNFTHTKQQLSSQRGQEDHPFFNNNQNEDTDNLPLSPEQKLALKDEITQSLANQIFMSEEQNRFSQNNNVNQNNQQLQQDQQKYLLAQKTWLTVRSERKEEDDFVSETNDIISDTDKGLTAAAQTQEKYEEQDAEQETQESAIDKETLENQALEAQHYFQNINPSSQESNNILNTQHQQQQQFLAMPHQNMQQIHQMQQQQPYHLTSRNQLDKFYNQATLMQNQTTSKSLSSNIASTFYQKTLASDRESVNQVHQRQHLTQNSDLIDQLGGHLINENQQISLANSGDVNVGNFASQVNSRSQLQHQNGNEMLVFNSFSVPNGLDRQQHYQTQVQQPQLILQEFGAGQIASPQSQLSGQFQQNISQQQQQQPPMQPEQNFNEPYFNVNNMPPGSNFDTYNTNVNNEQQQMLQYNDLQNNQQSHLSVIPMSQQLQQSNRPVSNNSIRSYSNANELTNKSKKGSMYDVRAEGSIINIKKNTFGDPEMLILSSRKDIRDMMNSQQAIRRKSSGPVSKSKSQSRSRSRPKRGKSNKAETRRVSNSGRAQRPPIKLNNEKHRSVSNTNRMSNQNANSGKVGIRKGTLIPLQFKKYTKNQVTPTKSPKSYLTTQVLSRKQKTPMSKESRCRKISTKNVSPGSLSRITNRLKTSSKRQERRQLNRHRSEAKSISARSTENAFHLEKELIRSLKGMRRENFTTKRELKALYDHKLEKLRDRMLQERIDHEKVIKDRLKFQKHATNVHKKRANTYKATADELVVIADKQRKQNKEIVEVMARRRQNSNNSSSRFGRGSMADPISRSISYKRSSNYFGSGVGSYDFQLNQPTMFGALGSTHQPGFSHISNQMPRNNHNFVKDGGNSQLISSRSGGVRLSGPIKGVSSHISRISRGNQSNHNAGVISGHLSRRSRSNNMSGSGVMQSGSGVMQKGQQSIARASYRNDMKSLDSKICYAKQISSDLYESQALNSRGSMALGTVIGTARHTARHTVANSIYMNNNKDQNVTQSIKRQSMGGGEDLIYDEVIEALTPAESPQNRDVKLISDDLIACLAPQYQDQEDEGLAGVKFIHKSRDPMNPINSRQTFGGTLGLDGMQVSAVPSQTFSSPRSFEGIQKGHKSLFDASHRMLEFSKDSTLHSKEKSTAILPSPLRDSDEIRKRKLLSELSGARFKCTNCKASRIQVELPCAKCKELNCHADQKQQSNHRKKDSIATDNISWNSSDLNSEYVDSSRRESKKVISSKLLQCSSDLMANQARLDQIQKILFQPRQPRQMKAQKKERSHNRHKHHGNSSNRNYQASYMTVDGSSATLDDHSEDAAVTLPQMIDRLRKSRQNLKF